ncbi:hypothetical protein ABPG74_016023 [Tetrahymena malaccensis]
MGQSNNKLANWVEKAQNLERDLEQILHQLDSIRILMFDLAEIPHLRDINDANFQRDLFLIENALSYMNQSYSQKIFIKEISSNIKKTSNDIIVLKNLLVKLNKNYENLVKQYDQYQGADTLIQNLLQTIDWKRQALINYFRGQSEQINDCVYQSLYEFKSEVNVGTRSTIHTFPQLVKQSTLD